jgi:hypothetical protein
MVPTVEHKIILDNVFKNVKSHFERHKVAYSLGAGVAVAGITCLIMRGTGVRGAPGVSGVRGAPTNIASFIFRSPQTVNITTVLDREGRGHPGWPVRNLETKRIFFSQKEAADAFGIRKGVMSGHINGKFPDIDGLHFERVNLIPTT